MSSELTDSFRDRLSTISEDGKRLWVYARKPRGKIYNYRWILAIFLLAFFIFVPFIKVHGDQLLLFNFVERRFNIFGVIFWPQDFYLFVLSMITFIVFIVLFTVVYGRIFCGWICPQTIFMEFVFRQIEYLIEGSPVQQRRLDDAPWTLGKIWRKSLKHAVFYILSFGVGNLLLSYLISMDQVILIIKEGPSANLAGFIGMVAFSFLFYFIFSIFREQACIIVCPYGRLQGVLLDRNSIIVSYDYRRGEPRGPLASKEDRKSAGKGDCVDCNACLAVCPTGIDIRNGTQLECINCTACIDACNIVMARAGLPKGLIRYASENSIAAGTKLKFNFRVMAYSAVLALLLILITYLFGIRTEIETTILRLPGTLYQQYDATHISNIYSLQIINKSHQDLPVNLRLLEPENGELKILGDKITVKKAGLYEARFMIILDKSHLENPQEEVKIELYSGEKKIQVKETTFVGPGKHH